MSKATAKADFFGLLILFGIVIGVGGDVGIAIVIFAVVATVVILVIGSLFDVGHKAITAPRIVRTRRLRIIPAKATKPVAIEKPKTQADRGSALLAERQKLLAQIDALDAPPEEKETYREAVIARIERLLSEV